MKWISVGERLPEYIHGEQVVLVAGYEHGERYVSYAEVHAYGKKEKAEDMFSIPGWSQMHVTHWMPLPEPPK
jgi:hypothetical protein